MDAIKRSVCAASVPQGRYEWPDLVAASPSVCSSASAPRKGRSPGAPSAAARPSAVRQQLATSLRMANNAMYLQGGLEPLFNVSMAWDIRRFARIVY